MSSCRCASNELLSHATSQLLTGLILNPVLSEFKFQQPFLSLALNIGLFVGAVFWGLGCDVWGRRYVFHSIPALLHIIHSV